VRRWSDYKRRLDEARPAGIMIGREAARRPWIFALLRGRESSEDFSMEVDLRAAAFRMLDLIESRLIAEFRLTRAQRFFFYFADNFKYAHYIKWKLINSPDLDAMRKELDAYFEEAPGDRIIRFSE
jgi:tRNA-dihydrouridine synthase